ncbi:hypothetical protein J2S43_007091 [Catenuloplanes nepalensis]|uniref:Secreted protein n=1 Tax=Catenuloplanes nepalensis TaxID=587533 RepID=A0ABT9N4E5_9ACTN|nr:hypothetical protein [Catenuloplanes nepalensis]MDP9798579.1 hypothetical protein [Catenuloplanes nepalensis]
MLVSRTLVALGVSVLGAVVLAACGAPPGLEEQTWSRPGVSASVPVLDVPSLPSVPDPWLTPTAPPTEQYAETVLVPCQGDPAAADVIAVLGRTGDLVPAGGTARVTSGPFCAGTWQLSLVAIPEAEPLFVVTSGLAETLKLVTAGTNVCSARVRGAAPSAVRAVACGEAPLPTASTSPTPTTAFQI